MFHAFTDCLFIQWQGKIQFGVFGIFILMLQKYLKMQIVGISESAMKIME